MGCSDVFFATQEPGTLARGLLSACVSLSSRKPKYESAVLLYRPAFFNWKTWRLIRNWYENGVKVDGRSSPTFPVERGFVIRLSPFTNSLQYPYGSSPEKHGGCRPRALCNNLCGGAYLR